ncbi:hypothetical protein FACHB389_06035, partial [Nostoc calcicola FACHB-389]
FPPSPFPLPPFPFPTMWSIYLKIAVNNSIDGGSLHNNYLGFQHILVTYFSLKLRYIAIHSFDTIGGRVVQLAILPYKDEPTCLSKFSVAYKNFQIVKKYLTNG